MYGSSGLSYSRYRPTTTHYGDDSGDHHRRTSTATTSGGTTAGSFYRPATYAMTKPDTGATPRRPQQRYARSSTTSSVAQLLSDSCSSLLQKLNTRLRGPSATEERQFWTSNHHANPLTTSKSTTVMPNFASTRSRFEDKYSSVLDKIYRRKDHDKTLEPTPLTKSSTTSNILLSEKLYPTNSLALREKTPFRNDRTSMHHTRRHCQPEYSSYLDRDGIYGPSTSTRARHKSNHPEIRPNRRSTKPQRSGKSEANDRRTLKLQPVEIKLNDDATASKKPEDGSTPKRLAGTPDPVGEREAKRKEIQSLIMKYAALDETFNRTADTVADGSGADAEKSKGSNAGTMSVAAAITQKYYPNLLTTAVVSNACSV